nr:MAG TPA: hypothetical protein [Caudoviricetes sp.]
MIAHSCHLLYCGKRYIIYIEPNKKGDLTWIQ